MKEAALKINEIFYSLQGESRFVGKPTTFIRLATCNMRCTWCDTKYAFWEGERKTLSEVLKEVKKHPTKYVCVTGGEPLGQKATIPLLETLIKEGYKVSLETGGGMIVEGVPEKVMKVIDIKCPDSGETGAMEWRNLQLANKADQFKFVIASKRDFLWAKELIQENDLCEKCEVLVSPVSEKVDPSHLADWVLESGVPVTYQKQLHKDLWGSKRAR